MKKILSVLCALAFIASFACIGASAADALATFSLVANTPVENEDGTLTATVDLVLTAPTEDNISNFAVFIDYDEALTLVNCKKTFANGMGQTSSDYTVKPYKVIWIEIDPNNVPEAGKDTVMFTLTFELPAEAEIGSTYGVTVAIDEENLPASTGSSDGSVPVYNYTMDDLAVNNTEIEVVEETTPPETSAPTEAPVVTEPEDSATDTADVTEAPKDDDKTEAPATTTEAPATTKAPDKSSQTGDMMFVVVAVMVVALGAAVVVKKVNVK